MGPNKKITLGTTRDQNIIEGFFKEVCIGFAELCTIYPNQSVNTFVKKNGIWAEHFLKIIPYLKEKGYLVPQIIIDGLEDINANFSRECLCVLGLANVCNDYCAVCKNNKFCTMVIKSTSTHDWFWRDIEYRRPGFANDIQFSTNIKSKKKCYYGPNCLNIQNGCNLDHSMPKCAYGTDCENHKLKTCIFH